MSVLGACTSWQEGRRFGLLEAASLCAPRARGMAGHGLLNSFNLANDIRALASALPTETPMNCGHQCHEIGGPYIAENPACPIHGTNRVDTEGIVDAARALFAALDAHEEATDNVLNNAYHPAHQEAVYAAKNALRAALPSKGSP